LVGGWGGGVGGWRLVGGGFGFLCSGLGGGGGGGGGYAGLV